MLPPFMEERAQACGAGPVEPAWVKRYCGDTPFWEKPTGEWTLSEPSHVVDAAVLVDDEPEHCVDECLRWDLGSYVTPRDVGSVSGGRSPDH